MDINTTVDLVGDTLIGDVFGTALIGVLVLIIFVTYLALKSNISLLEIGIIFIMPVIYLAAQGGMIPLWIGYVVLILAGIIAALGMWRIYASA